MKKYTKQLITILQGMVMGIAEILPGVSGSTFALIMGIYDDFILFLHNVPIFAKEKLAFLTRKKTYKELLTDFVALKMNFGVYLVLGMAISVAILSNVVGTLLDEYPQYVSAFFFGLVLVSITIPWEEMTSRKPIHFATMILTGVLVFLLLGLDPAQASEKPDLLMLFFGGIVGISGMVLPGISGSFILLLLGLYEFIIDSIKSLTRLEIDMDTLVSLGVFALGLVVGFSVFVRILKKSLEKFPNLVMSFLIGLMLGSLRALYPFFEVLDTEGEVIEKQLLGPFETVSEYNLFIIYGLVLFAIVGVVLINQKTSVDREQIEKLEES